MKEEKRVCDICGGVLDTSKNKDVKYCSDACKMKAYRASKKAQSVTNDAPIRNDLGEQSVTLPEKNSVLPTAKTMNAEQLYSAISSYQGGEWIDSIEFEELKRRLSTWGVKKLREKGYWIPNAI